MRYFQRSCTSRPRIDNIQSNLGLAKHGVDALLNHLKTHASALGGEGQFDQVLGDLMLTLIPCELATHHHLASQLRPSTSTLSSAVAVVLEKQLAAPARARRWR